MGRESSSLGIFRTDSGITLSFGANTYFIDSDDPFHNIADKALNQEDYVPLASVKGACGEVRNMLLDMIIRQKAMPVLSWI